jgi:hypothetical protein
LKEKLKTKKRNIRNLKAIGGKRREDPVSKEKGRGPLYPGICFTIVLV